MRRSRHTDDEIAFLLKEAERGIAVAAICASAHVSLGTFYRWRRRLGRLPPTAIRRLQQMEEENRRLRAQVARLAGMSRGDCNPAPAQRKSLQSGSVYDAKRLPIAPHRACDMAVGRFAFVRTAL
jgi:putative transposase